MRNFTAPFLLAAIALVLNISQANAQGDTTWVQTYTWEEQNNPETAYDSPGKRWFQFPESDNGEEYRKVLMYHKLKCFSNGTAGNLGYACGEWDYLTYNYLFDHTGMLDSNALSHSHYHINNLEFDTDSIIFNPLDGAPVDSLYTEYSRTVFEYPEGYTSLSELSALNSTTQSLESGRYQFVWTLEDFESLQLVPGESYTTLAIPSDNFSADLLTLKFKQIADTSVVSPILNGWTKLYEYPVSSTDTIVLGLDVPIVWDGVSSIAFDLSIEGGSSSLCEAFDRFNQAIHLPSGSKYVNLDGGDNIEVLVETVQGITSEVTVELWTKGDADVLPVNTTTFEGLNSSNQRELNVHHPWSNSRIYWDAGNDGGYDRIDKAATDAEIEGDWVHWAFTKDAAAGVMNIYKNGTLWHTGSGKDNEFNDVVKMFVGSSAHNSYFYHGGIEDFRVWNSELSSEEISEWRFSTDLTTHPQAASLLLQFDFDGENGTFEDGGYYRGDAGRIAHKSSELFQNPEPCAVPALEFVSGSNATSYEEYEVVLDVVEIAPVSVTTWEVDGNEITWSDISYGWPHDVVMSTVNQVGDTVSTYPIEGEVVPYSNSELDYFGYPYEVIDRYELGRYITPYGIGLSLGNDGWTWIYDVTDYLPLLRDSVELECGNWQELLDLKFAFIKGTAPRDVMGVEAFWNGTYNLNTWDDNVVAHEYTPSEGEEMFKLITRASGHWFGEGNNCAEFCYNTHTAKLNNQILGSWEIMQECADNPLYPQGGTWIYDRAAWCPGDKVSQQEFELTDFVTPGEAFDVEYDVTYDPYGNYRMEGQIISYGSPNMDHDVELMDILAPNNRKVLSRWNPVCEDPKVLIRNNGSQPLNSCTFVFGIDGEEMQTYVWEAPEPLGFLETAEVSLPYDSPNYTIGDDEDVLTFKVSLEVADAFDQEPNNGTGYSQFRRPPTYQYNDLDDNRVIVWTKTNNKPFETSVELRNSNEELIWSRSYNTANTTFKDTLALNAGCYRFTVLDSDDDGMDFWANSDGVGYVKLKKVAGSNFTTLEADFGKSISQTFRFETDLVNDVEEVVAEEEVEEVKVYPNPATANVLVSIENWDGDIDWEMRNSLGELVRSGQFANVSNQVLNIDVEELATGLYSLSLSGGGRHSMQWVVKN